MSQEAFTGEPWGNQDRKGYCVKEGYLLRHIQALPRRQFFVPQRTYLPVQFATVAPAKTTTGNTAGMNCEEVDSWL